MKPRFRVPSELSRRSLLQSTLALGGAWAAGAACPDRLLAAEEAPAGFAPGSVILFQGDSITDAGRDRRREDNANSAGACGRGYPFLLASHLLAQYPTADLKCYNRGISGNKVPDLDARWKKDALDLEPALLSILIGVNDIWHKLNGRYDGTVADYEEGFNALLARTREALPKTRFVVCEPFVLRCGAVNDSWFPEFDERRAAARRVAEKANATWVPFQSMFDAAVEKTEPSYWAGDGVHPSMAGHALMARTWLETVKP